MVLDKCNVAGSVILYNRSVDVIDNIETYLSQIDHLFVIDNSETMNNELVQLIKQLPNVTYLFNRTNMGVAYALNQAATMAITAGYKFLLTMDDDTSLPTGAIQNMLTYANKCGFEKLGIIGGQSDPRFFNDTINLVPYTITSGNLLSLSAYKECGPFMNELFIDFVDHEYCFRLINKEYKVVEMNNIYLTHNLGQKKQLAILNYEFPIYWISYNPTRIYYKTRNCFFVLRKYKYLSIGIRIIFYKQVFKDLIKIILLENNKKDYLANFSKAILDAFKGTLGKKVIMI